MTHSRALERDDSGAFKYWAGGEWRSAGAGRTFDVLDPYSGERYASVAACGGEEAGVAIRCAAAAQPAWAATSPAEKVKLFTRIAEVVRSRSEEVVEALIRETGCTDMFARGQQDTVQTMLHLAGQWVHEPRGEVLASNYAGSLSIAVRRPLGVVASITPWNGGSVLAWRSILAPLAAGNTVVVKPSEESPVSAGLLLASVLDEAGAPAGIVNVVTHAPGEVGPVADALFGDDAVRCINFIGSVPTGRRLAERAGSSLKRSVMELGGMNAMIVLADADIEYAGRVAAFNSFFHQGQICLNTRRILVARSVHDEFVEHFVHHASRLETGDPSSPSTIVGPLINDCALRTVTERVEHAVSLGARLACGGGSQGRVFEPTILLDVPAAATMRHEETFGPVAMVDAFDDVDDAVDRVNSSLYGLTTSIISQDTFGAMELAGRLHSGSIHINSGTVNDEQHAPVGGVRDSGWGRSGPHAIHDFTDLVWMTSQKGDRIAW